MITQIIHAIIQIIYFLGAIWLIFKLSKSEEECREINDRFEVIKNNIIGLSKKMDIIINEGENNAT